MTEYTTSSQAIREHMTSIERTAYWVQSHGPSESTQFYSPSVPPSVLEDAYFPSSPPSEAESSRSIPPRMVLRWGGSRPDVPIPSAEPRHRRHRNGSSASSRSPTSPTSPNFPQNPQHRGRSDSYGGSPLARTHHHSPPAPEEIRILPSNTAPRSKSLPRSADVPASLPGPMPQPPAFTPQPWHPYAQGRKPPPAIVYAPSHASARPRYAPPAMYHHPPQMGPNGLIYSHSAPVGSAHHPQQHHASSSSHHHSGGGLPSSMVPPAHTLAAVREEDQRAGTWSGRTAKARSMMARRQQQSPSESSESLDSQNSGSTYYILPSAGQKVHVITPSPEASVATATSTTRSPTSPHSSSFKKAPFFRRLLSFAGRFSPTSSYKAASAAGSGRRLQRRHSTGGSARRPTMER